MTQNEEIKWEKRGKGYSATILLKYLEIQCRVSASSYGWEWKVRVISLSEGYDFPNLAAKGKHIHLDEAKKLVQRHVEEIH